jgi:hypothetical protein
MREKGRMRPKGSLIYMFLVQLDYGDLSHYCGDSTHFCVDSTHLCVNFIHFHGDSTDQWKPLLGMSEHSSDCPELSLCAWDCSTIIHEVIPDNVQKGLLDSCWPWSVLISVLQAARCESRFHITRSCAKSTEFSPFRDEYRYWLPCHQVCLLPLLISQSIFLTPDTMKEAGFHGWAALCQFLWATPDSYLEMGKAHCHLNLLLIWPPLLTTCATPP